MNLLCTPRPRTGLRTMAVAIFAVCAIAPTLAQAADCPQPPEGLKERRVLAKEWFGRAEAEEANKDDVAAVKAYSCSFTMVPHAFTAYNLARAAERAGDLRLALSAHRDYLTLKPDAQDRAEIESRMKDLEARLAATSTPPPPSSVPQTTETPVETPPPPPVVAPEPVRPTHLRERSANAERSTESGSRMGVPQWIIAGVGAAALTAGVVLNLGARSAMDDCRARARKNDLAGALDSCNRGKTLAYTSYGMFGAAGLAAAVDIVMILSQPSPRESVGVALLPGGALLSAGRRF